MRLRAARQADRLSQFMIIGLFVNAAVGFGLYFRERQRADVTDESFFEQLASAKDAAKEEKRAR